MPPFRTSRHAGLVGLSLAALAAAVSSGGARALAQQPPPGVPATPTPLGDTPAVVATPAPRPTQTPFGSGLPAQTEAAPPRASEGRAVPGGPVRGHLYVPFVVGGVVLSAGEPVEEMELPLDGAARSAGGTIAILPPGTVLRFPRSPQLAPQRVVGGPVVQFESERSVALLLQPLRLPRTGDPG